MMDKNEESYMGASSLGLGIGSPAAFLSNKNNSNLDSTPSMFKKSSSSAFNSSGSPLSVE